MKPCPGRKTKKAAGGVENAFPASSSRILDKACFARIRSAYEGKWSVQLVVLDLDGVPVMGRPPPDSDTPECRRLFKTQMQNAARWGDASFELLPDGAMLWMVPLMLNQKLTGGVAAYIPRRRGGSDTASVSVHEVAVELRRILEAENLTNASLLAMRRDQYMSERRRAEAIHAFKAYPPDFRAIYIRDEPALMAAIRKGDREEARGLLNRILVVMHHRAGDNLTLIKSFFLEMVTLMCRTAVEAGCDARELLGKNYEAFTALAAVNSDDELGPWLHAMLERLLDGIHQHRNASPTALLQSALAYMHENMHLDISRDQAAKAAHLSPAHFSRIFKKEIRESFTSMLNRMRIAQAAEFLARTDRSLCLVALDCGFKDQSYFTKVFRRYMQKTPREYRMHLRSSRKEIS